MRFNKIYSILMIFVISFSITFGCISYVYAADTTGWDGVPPFINTGSLSLSNDYGSVISEPYSFYSYKTKTVSGNLYYYIKVVVFGFNSLPDYTSNGYSYINTGNFNYTHNNINYSIPYAVIHYDQLSSSLSANGTLVNWFNSDLDVPDIIKFFLFGVGNYWYEQPEPPAEDIDDSALDIKGLTCTLVNDQNNTVNWINTYKNRWNNFVNVVYNELTGTIKDAIIAEGDMITADTVDVVIPGVALIWDSPEISVPPPIKETDINYKVWIDGRSEIKYKDSLSGIIADILDTSTVASCAYNKLLINDDPIVQPNNSAWYYNTNNGLDAILEYIENNSTWTRPSSYQLYQAIYLQTTISRVYIQAYQVDLATGDTHYGAVSYVDLSSGIPEVHEGTTTSIDDVPADDNIDGITQTTGQPYTVSGNNIVYGDTIYNNNYVNNYYGTGLILPPGSNFFAAGIALIQAVLELIKLLFLTRLIPFITLGFTGHF